MTESHVVPQTDDQLQAEAINSAYRYQLADAWLHYFQLGNNGHVLLENLRKAKESREKGFKLLVEWKRSGVLSSSTLPFPIL